MTGAEAIGEIRAVGTVALTAGAIRAWFPESERCRLEPAIEAIRENRAAVIDALQSEQSAVLNRAGVRIMRIDGRLTIGIWRDADGPELRVAIRALEMGNMPVRYLDEPDIPTRYKVRTRAVR